MHERHPLMSLLSGVLYVAGFAVPIAGLWIATGGGREDTFDAVVFVSALAVGIWLMFCAAVSGVLLEIADSLWERKPKGGDPEHPRLRHSR